MQRRLPTIFVIAGLAVAAVTAGWFLRAPQEPEQIASLQVGLLLDALAQVDGGLPGDLQEGDLISATGSDDPDVYIVNEYGFKRLFLNPAIFGFYGHLGGFANVKTVMPQVRDAYSTSSLFRNCETEDEKVYGVVIAGEDAGTLHWVNVTGAQAVSQDSDFFRKVFCINTNEFDWYSKGTTFTSIAQVPDYSRTATPTPSPTSIASISPTPTPVPTPGVSSQPDAYSPVARIVGDEQSVIAARFKFTAAIDNFKINRINLEIADASGIAGVRLRHEGSLVKALPAQTDMTFYISPFDQVLVRAGQFETLDVELILGTIATPNGGVTGANHTVTLDKSESRAIATTSGVESAISGDDLTGEPLYAYKAVPFVSRLNLPNNILLAGGAINTIAKFTITSGGTGDIGWQRIRFNYTVGDSITSLSGITVHDANSGTQIAGTVASTSAFITFTATNEQSIGDYLVKARVNGTTTGDDYVVVNWRSSGLGYAAPTTAALVDASSSLVWTDQAVAPHSTATSDWNNDYLVKYLDLDSWSLLD